MLASFSIGAVKWITYPSVSPNRYTISEFGVVADIVKNRYMVPYITPNGYMYYRLWCDEINTSKHYAAHRLVAWEFVPTNRDLNLDVNHIDGNKLNNHYTNLEWCTRSENIIHANLMGLTNQGDHRGDLNGQAKLSNDEVRCICEIMEECASNGISRSVADCIVKERLGDISISDQQLCKIRCHRTWTHISKDYDF